MPVYGGLFGKPEDSLSDDVAPDLVGAAADRCEVRVERVEGRGLAKWVLIAPTSSVSVPPTIASTRALWWTMLVERGTAAYVVTRTFTGLGGGTTLPIWKSVAW